MPRANVVPFPKQQQREPVRNHIGAALLAILFALIMAAIAGAIP